ncbi:DNA-directed RNA polymerase subunit alpha, partial [Patescibacteria group bacterium]|nr:DNA-directed RNA polymerase subunit alpha [Patescibacteria group bacterium]
DEEEEEDEVMGKLVQELNLSTRTANALDKAKIRKVGDLVQRSEDQLLSLEGFGETALKEIQKSLKKFKVTLKEEE